MTLTIPMIGAVQSKRGCRMEDLTISQAFLSPSAALQKCAAAMLCRTAGANVQRPHPHINSSQSCRVGWGAAE